MGGVDLTPYIKKELRKGLDGVLFRFEQDLAEWYVNEGLNPEEPKDTPTIDGIVNYVFTKLCQYFYLRDKYQTLARAVMTLEQVKDEWQRRAIHKYEDKKRKEEGDVFFE